jgi:ParB-like chromosome segregation protein Spo0J
MRAVKEQERLLLAANTDSPLRKRRKTRKASGQSVPPQMETVQEEGQDGEVLGDAGEVVDTPEKYIEGSQEEEGREEEGMTEKGVQELREILAIDVEYQTGAVSPENSPGVITNDDVHATDVTMAENVEEEQEEETSSSGTSSEEQEGETSSSGTSSEEQEGETSSSGTSSEDDKEREVGETGEGGELDCFEGFEARLYSVTRGLSHETHSVYR